MPAVNEIPSASTLQQQLSLIEQALNSLNAGDSSITAMTVTENPPGPETRCIIDPGLNDATTIANVTTLLQTQQTYLINQLETLGYTYTGTAIPSAISGGPPNPSLPVVPSADKKPLIPASPQDPPPIPPIEDTQPPEMPPADPGVPPPPTLC